MNFKHFLKKQLLLHPCMQPQEIIKLYFQAPFGTKNLLHNIGFAQQYFNSEFDAISPDDAALYEQISEEAYRINLSAWKKNRLPQNWLFEMLLLSTNTTHINNEFPCYRIVSKNVIRLIPLLLQLNMFDKNDKTYVIAIDGRSTSGKTTIAYQLEKIINSATIHMDDFFLPMSLRTKNRIAEIGGNVDYERFIEQVIPNLSTGKAFSYQRFDCTKMAFNGFRKVKKSPFYIVEGAYSCHPKFNNYMDIKVFSDISPDQQKLRIEKRERLEAAAVYFSQWIPMEELYLKTFAVKEKADIIL